MKYLKIYDHVCGHWKPQNSDGKITTFQIVSVSLLIFSFLPIRSSTSLVSGKNESASTSTSTSTSAPVLAEKAGKIGPLPIQLQLCPFDWSRAKEEANVNLQDSEINHSGQTWTVPASITFQRVDFTVVLSPKSGLKCSPGVAEEGVTLTLNQSLSTAAVPQFLNNGYFQANDVDYFHPREYCISELTPENVTVRYCARPRCGPSTPCIRKCCPLGQIFIRLDKSTTSCTALENVGVSSSNFHPVLYSSSGKVISKKNQVQRPIHYLRKRKKTFNCSETAPLLMSPYATSNQAVKDLYGLHGLCFQIREDGTLRYRNDQFEWAQVNRDDYCMDGSFYPELDKTFLGREEDFVVLLCAMKTNNHAPNQQSLMYGSALIISSVFLLLTFLVYLLLWGQQTICGWVTMSHAASMFFAYLFLGTAFLILYTAGATVNQTLGCKILGILAHFFFLSTFCWLSVISFDLFWTFRCFTPRSQRSKGFGRYLIYCFFGWGLPLIFVGSSVAVDYIYGSDPCSMVLIPSYGVQNCYVAKNALGRYIYYPIAFLLGMNLLFFTVTTYKLHEYKKSTRMATQNMQERQQLFKLFIKLYFIMGVTWIFEFLSWWAVGLNVTWYWAIFDLINVLQAVAIFIIFVCKKGIARSLIREYPRLAIIVNPLARCFRCYPAGRDMDNTTVTGVMTTTPTLRLKSMKLNEVNKPATT